MFLKVFRDFSKPQWFQILNLLKRSTGMSVHELSKAMKMSYMGVKQHCVEMEKKGYLDTWRRPKDVGRPEKAYRLTEKSAPLFPQVGNDLILKVLESTQALFGPNVPEKLLYSYFQEQTESYLKKLRGKSVVEKASSLAKMRDQSGYMSECLYDNQAGLRIVEYHNPLRVLAERYRTVERMEETMFERVLGTKVKRSEEKASGLRRYVFEIETLGRKNTAEPMLEFQKAG